MRLRNLFFALAASIGVAAAPAGAQEMADSVVSGPLMLTLEQALDIALSENPTVKIADQTVEVKKYAKRGTYAGLWPEISASATYNRYIKKQTMHIMDQTMTVGTSNIYQGGFSATMPVVNAQLWKSLKISAMDVELAVEQARGSRIDMIEQVSKAFYQVLLAKDSYTVYKRVYDNAVENHKIVTKKYEVGSVSEYEFLRSKVTVSNAEPDVLNAENSIVVALWQLKALLGMDLDIDIDCAGSLADYESMMTSHFDMAFNPERNSEMKQLEIQERQLQKTLEMQRAANLPTLDISASYNFGYVQVQPVYVESLFVCHAEPQYPDLCRRQAPCGYPAGEAQPEQHAASAREYGAYAAHLDNAVCKQHADQSEAVQLVAVERC